MNAMAPNITRIKELRFSDLYLGHPSLGDRFADVAGAATNAVPAIESLRNDLRELHSICKNARPGGNPATSFKVRYDEVSYRVSVMNTQGGEVFVLRKIIDHIASLCDIGIPQVYIQHLMMENMAGLFIISGAVKSGKTTTACALMKDRLTVYGGVGVTMEDPIELPLEGMYGQGVCYQTHAPRTSNGFAESFRRLSRWGAKIILVDEIRDQDEAVELLRASINGHLVVTTMLAEDVVKTITKLHSFVNERLPAVNAQALLENGLAGILNQQIVAGVKQTLETEFLFLLDSTQTQMRTILRNGNYEILTSEIKKQMGSMISKSAVGRRFTEG